MHLETLTYDPARGWSTDPLPLLDSEQTLVLVFGARSFGTAPAPILDLVAAYPRACFMGCSTSGEIFGQSIRDGSLAVALVEFEHSRIVGASARVGSSHESFEAGRSLASRLKQDDLRAVLVLSDGLRVNGSELVAGLNSVLPAHVVVTGGLAGDGADFRSTWVLEDGRPAEGVVSAVGLYGERLRVGHGSRGGWDRFGPVRTVTCSSRNVLYELDGKPALELYKTYLGDRAGGLPATALLFPLALRARADDSKELVRTVLSVDEAAQSMTFAGDLPQGSLVQLMRANFDDLVEGAQQAALFARGVDDTSADALAIAISCVGRRLVLGQHAEEEVEASLASFPAGTRQVGFYSYGEISPFASGHCDLHNQTMTLTTIRET